MKEKFRKEIKEKRSKYGKNYIELSFFSNL